MKKRLFISSILMTLVLLVAITTATFAWYSATSSATARKGELGSKTISVADSEYSLGNILVNIHMENPAGSVKLSDNDKFSYVLVGGTKTKDTSITYPGEGVASILYTTSQVKVSFTIQPAGEASAREASVAELKGIAGVYVITFTPSNQAKVGASAVDAVQAYTYATYYSAEEASAYNLENTLGENDEGFKHEGDPKDPEVYATATMTFTITADGVVQFNSSNAAHGDGKYTLGNIYLAVQGGAGEETSSTFTTNVPAVAATAVSKGGTPLASAD